MMKNCTWTFLYVGNAKVIRPPRMRLAGFANHRYWWPDKHLT
jgi:hypothetical protein